MTDIPRCPRCHAPLEDNGECWACAHDAYYDEHLANLRKLWGIDEALDLLIAVKNAGDHEALPDNPA